MKSNLNKIVRKCYLNVVAIIVINIKKKQI